VDNPADVFSYFVDNFSAGEAVSTISTGPLNGISSISLSANSIKQSGTESAELKLIPYYAWNNRGASKMMVWLPETEELAKKNYYIAPDFIEKAEASHTYQGDGSYGPENVNAIIDGLIPSGSGDKSIPRWTSHPQAGQQQQVEFTNKHLYQR
jgi:hypothetical protein